MYSINLQNSMMMILEVLLNPVDLLPLSFLQVLDCSEWQCFQTWLKQRDTRDDVINDVEDDAAWCTLVPYQAGNECARRSQSVTSVLWLSGHDREMSLKKWFLRSVLMVVLASLLQVVMVVTCCVKWQTVRDPLLSAESLHVTRHAFLTSLGFWFLLCQNRIHSSCHHLTAWKGEMERVFVLFCKEGCYQPAGLLSACFPETWWFSFSAWYH